jgi:hypothetical protein
MAIAFLIRENAGESVLTRTLALCEALTCAGEHPVLFSQTPLPIEALHRFPTKGVLPLSRSNNADRLRLEKCLTEYVEISAPAIVFEDTHPSGLTLPSHIFRILVVQNAEFTHLLRLRENFAEMYGRILIFGSTQSSDWHYSCNETAEILRWDRWRAIDAPARGVEDALESARSRGRRNGSHSFSEPHVPPSDDAGVLSELRARISNPNGAKNLVIRIDDVIDLDEDLDWLLRTLGGLNLCASLEVVPYLCRIGEADVDKYDREARLFEVSQHGYSHLPLTDGGVEDSEFSCVSEDPTCLEIANLEAGFNHLSALFPKRFNRGFSSPFDKVPAWLPQVWKDVGGNFLSCTEARFNPAALPVAQVTVRLWDRAANGPRRAEAVAAELVTSLRRRNYAGLIIRPAQMSNSSERRRLARLLEALLESGVLSRPLNSVAATQARALVRSRRRFDNQASDSIEIQGDDLSALTMRLNLHPALTEQTTEPFEVRLGFALRKSNLNEAVGFLDLCREFGASPQYAMASGVVPEEMPSSADDFKRFFATLELLDKELWARGFDHRLLTAALSGCKSLERRAAPVKLLWPQLICADSTAAGMSQLGRGLNRSRASGRPAIVLLNDERDREAVVKGLARNHANGNGGVVVTGGSWSQPLGDHLSEVHLSVPEAASAEAVRRQCEALVPASRQNYGLNRNRLVIHANSALKKHCAEALNCLRGVDFDEYSIQLPYDDAENPSAILGWREFVTSIKSLGHAKGWSLAEGRLDLFALGLDIHNQYPDTEVRITRRRHSQIGLSIVSAVYNREAALPRFIRSVQEQDFDEPFELVLVDDGSTDNSLTVAQRLCLELDPRIDVTMVTRERLAPYRQGTFSFRAGGARQCGLELAAGEQMLFVDPDQELAPDCVSQHRWWNKNGFEVVVGDRLYRFNGSYDPESIHWLRLRRRALQSYSKCWLSFYTGNSSVSRTLLDAAGGFDESLQYWGLDDTDLGYRLARAGASFWHTPRATVTHLDGYKSCGGTSAEERGKACLFIMNVMFRKYLDESILDSFRHFWAE